MKEKKGFKAWFVETKKKVMDFCAKHPDAILTISGGLLSLAGGALKLYANKSDYDDYLYTSVDNSVYKLPAKQMKTVKNLESSDD